MSFEEPCDASVVDAFHHLMRSFGIRLPVDLTDPNQRPDPCLAAPFVVVEECQYSGDYRVTCHRGPGTVGEYLSDRDVPEQWVVLAIHDLATGTPYTARTEVVPVGPAPSPRTVSDALVLDILSLHLREPPPRRPARFAVRFVDTAHDLIARTGRRTRANNTVTAVPSTAPLEPRLPGF